MTWLHKFFGVDFYSSRWPNQIGPTAENNSAAIPPPIFFMATYIFLNFSNQEGEESYSILQSPFDRHPLIFRKLQFLINFQILTRPLMGQAEFSCRDMSVSSASSYSAFVSVDLIKDIPDHLKSAHCCIEVRPVGPGVPGV